MTWIAKEPTSGVGYTYLSCFLEGTNSLHVLPEKALPNAATQTSHLAPIPAKSCFLHCSMRLWQVLIKLYLCRTKSPDSNILFTNISIWSNQNSCKTTSYLPFPPPTPSLVSYSPGSQSQKEFVSFKNLPVGGADKFSPWLRAGLGSREARGPGQIPIWVPFWLFWLVFLDFEAPSLKNCSISK